MSDKNSTLDYDQVEADLRLSSDDDFNLPSFELDENDKKKKKKGNKKGNKSSKKKNSKPTKVKFHLKKKSKERLEKIYKKYDDSGISLSVFEDCVNDLDLVDDQEIQESDVSSFFKEVTEKGSNADFDKFLEALAILSIKRFPDGLNEDFTAALVRLLDYLGPDEDDESLKKKRRAVYEAKKRAIARAKEENRQKMFEILSKEDEEKKALEEKKKQAKIAEQRALLRAKARMRAEKEKKAKEKKREEKELMDAEEKRLEQTKLRRQICLKALKRSQDRVAEFAKKEKEAEEEKKALAASKATDPAELAKKIKEAEERVKRAKQARQKLEAKQNKQKEYEEKLNMKLEEQRAEMSAEKSQKAIERAKKRLKAKLEAEKTNAALEEKEREERRIKNEKIVKEAVAKAGKRTAVKKYKINLDEETEADLKKMFSKYSHKEKMSKAQWKDFISKQKVIDGYKLEKKDLDLLFSKSVVKGKATLEFKQFCKAVGAVGNKRFPKKKNKDPNDAIARFLDATVRKNDPAEVKARKKELREQKKQFLKEQKAIDKKKQHAHDKELEKEREMQAQKRKEREERIAQQMKDLEEDRIEHEKLMKKRKRQEERRQVKEAKEKEEREKAELIESEKKRIHDEKVAADGVEKANARLKERKMKEKQAAEEKEKEEREKEEASMKKAEEGRKKAHYRVLDEKAKQVALSKEDTDSFRTLYDHYQSGNLFNRADWMNCVQSLGLMDDVIVSKKDLEESFYAVKKQGRPGINFEDFLLALSNIARLTHPGEEGSEVDNSRSKCMERLIFDVMNDFDDDPMEFDPDLGIEETEEEKAERLAAEKAKRKARKEERKKREKEARKKAEEEARIEAEKQKEKEKRLEISRANAAKRIAKRKKDEFTISDDDSDKLHVYYDYFKISPAGMSRGDWLNFLSTLEVRDDEIIMKTDCEEIYDKNCAKKTRGLSFKEYGVACSFIALRKYHEEKVSQSKALSLLVEELTQD